MRKSPQKTPLARLALLFFLQPLSSALWILPFGNVLASRGLGSLVPVVFAFPPISALFSPLLAGVMADHKIPSQRLLRHLLLGSSVMMFSASLAVEHVNTPLILALMLAHAVLFAPTGTLATAIVLATSSNPARHFPFFRIWSTLSWIAAGYFISFGIASDFSPRAMTAASVCELALALFTFALPPAPTPNLLLRNNGLKEILGLKAILRFPGSAMSVLLAIVAMTMCSSAVFFPYAPQLLRSADVARPSAWMTVSQWSEILFIGLLPLFLRRVKPQWLMFLGLGCGGMRCLSFMGYALGGGWPLAIVALAMHGPVTAFTFVTMQIFMEKNLPPEVRNRAQALVSVFGSGIGPLVGLMLSGMLASATGLSGCLQAGSWPTFWGAFTLLHVLASSFFFLRIRKGFPEEQINANTPVQLRGSLSMGTPGRLENGTGRFEKTILD